MTRRRDEPTIDMSDAHDPAMNAAVFLDGGLPRRVLRWFEHHLLECEDCWREVWLARRGRFLAEHAREITPAMVRDSVRGVIEVSAATESLEERVSHLRRWRWRHRGP